MYLIFVTFFFFFFPVCVTYTRLHSYRSAVVCGVFSSAADINLVINIATTGKQVCSITCYIRCLLFLLKVWLLLFHVVVFVATVVTIESVIVVVVAATVVTTERFVVVVVVVYLSLAYFWLQLKENPSLVYSLTHSSDFDDGLSMLPISSSMPNSPLPCLVYFSLKTVINLLLMTDSYIMRLIMEGSHNYRTFR